MVKEQEGLARRGICKVRTIKSICYSTLPSLLTKPYKTQTHSPVGLNERKPAALRSINRRGADRGLGRCLPVAGAGVGGGQGPGGGRRFSGGVLQRFM
jgi:hypothetical protein